MSIESVKPPEKLKDQVREALKQKGPLTHDELVQEASSDDSDVQRAVNELWREGNITHTLDRRFDIKQRSDE